MKTEIYTIKFVCETEEDRKKIHDAIAALEYEENMGSFSTELSQATLERSDLLAALLQEECKVCGLVHLDEIECDNDIEEKLT